MVKLNQDHILFVGEDLDINVPLDDVTLEGDEELAAFYRHIEGGRLEVTAPVEIVDNGPPALVKIILANEHTSDLTAGDDDEPTHTFSLERIDDGNYTPYSTGKAYVKHTARTGVTRG